MKAWIEDVVNSRRSIGYHYRLDNRDFELNCFMFVPSKDWACDMPYVEMLAHDLAITESNAEQIRTSIVDEDIPLEQELIYKDWRTFWGGGRRVNAIMLGEIRYARAIPELREVALHDLDFDMRRTAIHSIGRMREKARVVSEDLGKMLLDHQYWTKDCCQVRKGSYLMRGEIADALAEIKDPKSVKYLMEAGEGVVYELAGYDLEDYEDAQQKSHISDLSLSLQRIASALLKLNIREALALISKGRNIGGCFVIHHLKNSVSLKDPLHMPEHRSLWIWNTYAMNWTAI